MLVNNTGVGHKGILSRHPFMEIKNDEPGCLAQAKISIQYNIVHETLAPLAEINGKSHCLQLV